MLACSFFCYQISLAIDTSIITLKKIFSTFFELLEQKSPWAAMAQLKGVLLSYSSRNSCARFSVTLSLPVIFCSLPYLVNTDSTTT